MTLRRPSARLRISYGALLVVAACGGHQPPAPYFGSPADPAPTVVPQHQVTPPPIADKPPPPPASPPPEPGPEHLGTPASSKAQRPFWIPAGAAYAPQPAGRQRLFADAKEPLTSEQVGLVCNLVVTKTNHGEGDGLADLAAGVYISHNKKEIAGLYARGGDDTSEMWFTVPLVSPEKGAEIRVHSMDRDILFDDGIETVSGTFDGTYPFHAKGPVSRVECRPLGRATVEKYLETPRIRTDESLAAVERVKPDVHERYFGVEMTGDGGADRVRSYLDDMAGLVGWDDPRVVRRVERLVAQTQRIRAELGAAVEAKRASLPAEMNVFHAMADGGVHVRVTSYTCGPAQAKQYMKWVDFRTKDDFKAHPCVLAFDLENRTGTPLEVNEFRGRIGPLENLELISPQGVRFKLAVFGAVRGGKIERVDFQNRPIVPKDATISLLAHPTGNADSSVFAPPLLLRALHSKRRTGTPREWTSFLGGIVEMRATELVCTGKRCVLRAEVRRTGKAKVSMNAFFRRFEPSIGFRLLDPADFVIPKRKSPTWNIEDGIRGPLFQPYARIDQGKLQSFDKDFEFVTGQTITLQFGMTADDPLLRNMDLDKVVLDTWFDPVASFVRIEAPIPTSPPPAQ